MSNRDVAPPGQARLEAMLKDYGDRLSALENRRLQGALAIQSAKVSGLVDAGALRAVASAAQPVRLSGSAKWTQSIESYRTAGVTPAQGVTGLDALVTRDGHGEIIDMTPRPFGQYASGATQSIGSLVVVPITWAGGSQFSTPYPTSLTFQSGGVLIVPVSGIYDVYSGGAWPNVLGTKGRVVIIQLSTDNGASYPTLFADGRSGINDASLGQDVSFGGRSALLKGWRLRVAVIHGEVGALNYVASRFSFAFHSGFTSA